MMPVNEFLCMLHGSPLFSHQQQALKTGRIQQKYRFVRFYRLVK